MALADFSQRIEEWSASLLDPYTARIADQAPPSRNKEFNDPIWGTLVLRPFEVLFLDSPLLQRLRRIRQLGVVHFVYPAATHTRLEHSLGAVHQMDRLISVINAQKAVIEATDENFLRLCALCHDIGHGAMSHVSENALESLDLSPQLALEFSDAVGIEPRKLSEIVAYLVIGSGSFKALLETATSKLPAHLLPPDPIMRMQHAVVGQPMPSRIPLLNELISGPFDADKLDYLPRDAHMCGVPIVTDIPRLIQKVRAVEKAKADLPREILESITEEHASYWVLGIDLSGGRTLDELILGRTLLFDKLYRHQKVRAAEAMVAAILQQLTPLATGDPLCLPYEFDDDTLLHLNMDTASTLPLDSTAETATKAIDIASDISTRIRDRRLFVRAYAFAQNMPLDPFRMDREHHSGLSRLIQACRDAATRLDLETQLAEGTSEIIGRVDADEVLDSLAHKELLPYIRISPPQPPAQAGSSAFAYLIAGDNVLKFRDEAAEMTGWSNAYLLTRDIGYVFSPVELVPYVYLAAEKLFRETFGVRVPSLMLEYARQDASVIADLRRELYGGGFYDSAPFDLRPQPARLERQDVDTRLSDIRDRFAGYSGPVLQQASPGGAADVRRTSGSGGLLTDERMLAWLSQFRDENLVDSALHVIERVKLINRGEIVSALRDFLEANDSFRGSSLCVLGTTKDSSSIATYYAGDVANEFELTIRSGLEEALGRPEPIVFVDDFVGTGNQAVTIVCSWLDEDPGTDLGEERGAPLSAAMATELKGREIAFVFAAGAPGGGNSLQDRASALGLQSLTHVRDESLPTVFDSGIFPTKQRGDEFVERCRQIGAALLTNEAVGHDAAWAADRALGYGNNGFLVISEHNTPAQSLTCLWETGTVDGAPWMPLFPRRKKQ